MLVVPAYAKVNLALEVVGRRADGWHEISTVIAGIDWHDLVGVALRPRDGVPVRLRLCGEAAPAVPADEHNLAARAAAGLLASLGSDNPGLDLWLCKRIPAAAGLGGGSADAAAVLRAGRVALAAAGLPLSDASLMETAACLGSDVPALLAGGAVLARGRGTHLERLGAAPLHLAIAVAGESSTPGAYQALDDRERRGDGRVERLLTALGSGAAPADGDCGSALEMGARRASPSLASSLDRLRAAVPQRRWHLTGSGGAAFALAIDAAECASLAAAAASAGFPSRACRTVAAPGGFL
jgi:4-diphosphocytidyl-2-C-methyl-D-erythritol kinase